MSGYIKRYTDDELDKRLAGFDPQVTFLDAEEQEDQQRKPTVAQQEPEQEERGFWGTLGTSIARGANQTHALGFGALAVGADAIGADKARDWALEGYQEQMADADEYKAEIGTWDNVNSWGDFGTYATEAVGENITTLASILVSGGLGGAAAKAVAPKVMGQLLEKYAAKQVAKGAVKSMTKEEAARAVGQILGGYAASAAMESGSMYTEDVEEFGVDQADSTRALVGGAISGATDIAFGGEGALLRKFAGQFGERAGKQMTSLIGRELAKGFAKEGAQEMVQEAIAIGNNLVSTMKNNGVTFDEALGQKADDYTARLREAGIKGGIAGAGMGVAGHGLNKLNERSERIAAQDAAQGDVNSLTELDKTLTAQERQQAATQQGQPQQAVGTEQQPTVQQPSAAQQVTGTPLGINGPGGVTDAEAPSSPTNSQQPAAPQAQAQAAPRDPYAEITAQPLTDQLRTQVADQHAVLSHRLKTIGNDLAPQERQQLTEQVSMLEKAVAGMGKVPNGEPLARAIQLGDPTANLGYNVPRTERDMRALGVSPVADPIRAQAGENSARLREIEAQRQDRLSRNREVYPSQATNAYADEWAQAEQNRDARGGAMTATANRREGMERMAGERGEVNDLGAEADGMVARNTEFNNRMDRRDTKKKDMTGGEVTTRLQAIKQMSQDENISDEEWLGILADAERELPSSGRMKEWLKVIDTARQRVQAERIQKTQQDAETSELLGVMDKAKKEAAQEKSNALTHKATSQALKWANNTPREIIDLMKLGKTTQAKGGTKASTTPAEQAPSPSTAPASVAPAVKPQPEVVKDTAPKSVEPTVAETKAKIESKRKSKSKTSAEPKAEAKTKAEATTKEKVEAKRVKKTTPKSSTETAPVNKLTEDTAAKDRDEAPLPKSNLYDDDDNDTLSDPLSGYGSTLDYDGSKAEPVEDMADGYLNEDGDWVEGKKVEGKKKSTGDKKNKPMFSVANDNADSKAGSEYDAKDDDETEAAQPRKNLVAEARGQRGGDASGAKPAASFKKRIEEVFGKKSRYTTLDSGNIIVVTPNGSAILVRQKDVIIADPETGQRAHGAWTNQKLLAEDYGVTINRGGLLELAKVRKGGTLDHEQLHAAMSLALSSVERKVLYNRFKKDGMTRREIEEAIANDYQAWNPKNNNGMYDKFRRTMRFLASFFTELDPTTPDDVYRKMREGNAWRDAKGGRDTRRVEVSKDGKTAKYDGKQYSLVEDGRTILHSQLIEELSTPGRLPKKGSPSQMLKAIAGIEKGNKVKEEEFEWVGVRDWLSSMAYSDIVLEASDVLDFVKFNTPKLYVTDVTDRRSGLYREYSSKLGEESTYRQLLVTTPNLAHLEKEEVVPHPFAVKNVKGEYKANMDRIAEINRELKEAKLKLYTQFEIPVEATHAEINKLPEYVTKDEDVWHIQFYNHDENNDPFNRNAIQNRLLNTVEFKKFFGSLLDDPHYAEQLDEDSEYGLTLSMQKLLNAYAETIYAAEDEDVRWRGEESARAMKASRDVRERRHRYEDAKNSQAQVVRESDALTPNKSAAWRDPHFRHDDGILHMRFHTFESAEGKKTIVLEEVQSDFHQYMRKAKEREFEKYLSSVAELRGTSEEEAKKFLAKEMKDIDAYHKSNSKELYEKAQQDVVEGFDGVGESPSKEQVLQVLLKELRRDILQQANSWEKLNKPLKKSWHLVPLKYAIDQAVQNGYDQIIIPSGKDQAERYPGMGTEEAKGLAKFYNENLRNEYNKYLKKYDTKIVDMDHARKTKSKGNKRREVEIPEETETIRILYKDGVVTTQFYGAIPTVEFNDYLDAHYSGLDFDNLSSSEKLKIQIEYAKYIPEPPILKTETYESLDEFRETHPGMGGSMFGRIESGRAASISPVRYQTYVEDPYEIPTTSSSFVSDSIEKAMTIPVTDKMRQEIRKKTQPMYSLADQSFGMYEGMVNENPDKIGTIEKLLGPDKRTGLSKTLAVLKNLKQGDRDTFDHYKDIVLGHIRHNVFDIYDRVKTLGKQVDDALGGNIGDVAYKTMRLATSMDSVMSAFLQHGGIKLEDGVSKLTNTEGKGLIPLIEEMGDDFVYWLGERAAKRAQRLKAEKRENYFTDEDITNLLEMAEPRRNANSNLWEMADTRFNELQQSVLDFAVESGTIAREAVEAWHSADYIPFYRVLEDAFGENRETVIMPTGKEIISGIHKLRGRKLKTDDLLTNIVKNWSLILGQAMKNNARTKAIDMALMFGDDVVEQTNSKFRGERNVVNIMRNGKNEYYSVKDKYFLDALTAAPTGLDKNLIIKTGQQAKRLLTFGATITPDFRIANFIRDTIQTMALNKGYTFMDAVSGLKKAWRDDEDFVQLRAAGGAFNYGYLRGSDPENVQRYIEEVVVRKDGTTNIIKHSFKKAMDFWGKVGDAAENANRVALYSRLKAEGHSDLEAAYQAKDLLDFSMRGGSRSLAMWVSLVPFLNARLAGLYKVGREGFADKEKFIRIAGMLTTTSIALAAYNMAAHRDKWDKLQNNEKWNYYHFFFGDQHFRIPKPFELGAIFSSLPEAVMDAMDKKDADILAKWFMFTGSETLAMQWKPQAVKPLLELWANKNDFTGQDIVPMGMEYLAPSMQYKENTKEIYRKFGEAFNVSPVKVEHLVNGYLSSLGIAFGTLTDVALEYSTISPRKPFNQNNLWVVGRIMRDDSLTSSQAVSDFYDYARKVDEAVYTMRALKKDGDVSKLRDYVGENLDLIKDRKLVSKLKEQFSVIRTKRMLIMNSRTMSVEEKGEQLRALISRRNKLAARAVEYIKNGK